MALDDRIEDDLLLPQTVKRSNSYYSYNTHSRLHKIKHLIKKHKVLCFSFLVLILLLIIIIPIIVIKTKHHEKDDNKESIVTVDSISDQCGELGIQVMEEALKGTDAYYRLLNLTLFGSRLSGSDTLENAIDWLKEQMINDGFENVITQDVQVTNWKRGNEHASLELPYNKTLNMAGLGGSISTPLPGGLSAEVVVVSSFDELSEIGPTGIVTGKIVLFNAIYVDYSTTVQYRVGGAVAAAKFGAVAALVRSVTPYSLGTPHTGGMYYQENITQIPTAALTLEDSDLIQALYNDNQTIKINLYMEAQTLPPATSRNLMGEITGSEYPDQVVVIGGHIDAWDITLGAVDDGGGVMSAYQTILILKQLGIKPKRTIRMVAWVNEENGAAGAAAYAKQYASSTFFSIESDNGVTTPLGLTVSGLSNQSLSNLQFIANTVVAPYIGTYYIEQGGVGTDNEPLVAAGKPGANFAVDMTNYFWFHHSAADAIDKINSTQLDQCIGTMSALSICLANYNSQI